MGTETLVALGREAVLLMVLSSLPPLAASVISGLVMGFIQAVTQVQESSLSSVPKLAAAIGALVLAGPWIAAQLVRFTNHLFWALEGVRL